MACAITWRSIQVATWPKSRLTKKLTPAITLVLPCSPLAPLQHQAVILEIAVHVLRNTYQFLSDNWPVQNNSSIWVLAIQPSTVCDVPVKILSFRSIHMFSQITATTIASRMRLPLCPRCMSKYLTRLPCLCVARTWRRIFPKLGWSMDMLGTSGFRPHSRSITKKYYKAYIVKQWSLIQAYYLTD